ncbi:hypothetical protein CHUAL_001582 [Chamberlinius hualienensis]
MALSRFVTSSNLAASYRGILRNNTIARRDVLPCISSIGSHLPVTSVCISDKHNYKPRYASSLFSSINSRRHMGRLATTLVHSAPGSIQPYLKLMRLDKPIGNSGLFRRLFKIASKVNFRLLAVILAVCF